MSTALITGASRGFGQALATELADQGWTVIATGRNTGRLDDTRRRHSSRIITVRGDIRDHDHLRAAVAAAKDTGGLDLLVHNASALGGSPLPTLTELDPAELARIYAVNVVAPLVLTQLALPLLQAAPEPTILALSSDAAVEVYPQWGGYGSSKAALDHMMRVLAAEQGADSRLTVYAFDPGDMRTDMHQRAFPGEDISDRPLPGTVVPAVLSLLRQRPASGRYRASDLLSAVSS
jgi:NAD(P)-dependent dehydrogenase (short-subunit alcohol dehydrogenase family)